MSRLRSAASISAARSSGVATEVCSTRATERGARRHSQSSRRSSAVLSPSVFTQVSMASRSLRKGRSASCRASQMPRPAVSAMALSRLAMTAPIASPAPPGRGDRCRWGSWSPRRKGASPGAAGRFSNCQGEAGGRASSPSLGFTTSPKMPSPAISSQRNVGKSACGKISSPAGSAAGAVSRSV